MAQVAYGDESVRRRGVREPTYLLGAYIRDDSAPDLASELMALVRGRKLHWRDSIPRVQEEACRIISSHGGGHLIVAARPLAEGVREESARQQALMTLMTILSVDYGVDELVLERRQQKQDDKDRAVFAVARKSGMVSADFKLRHEYGAQQPMLWVPDQVLGAYGDACMGKTTAWTLLEPHVRIETIHPKR
ncbi:hypothetical protein [Actinomyces qiguomingii]|uniref:hypothetical protein n=1 Tax=Actinomyces qiguomingii TaxID=2057800 RepID=UPI000FFF51CF|nr:hypothetical protein [Actinomyces qiguomingii]